MTENRQCSAFRFAEACAEIFGQRVFLPFRFGFECPRAGKQNLPSLLPNKKRIHRNRIFRRGWGSCIPSKARACRFFARMFFLASRKLKRRSRSFSLPFCRSSRTPQDMRGGSSPDLESPCTCCSPLRLQGEKYNARSRRSIVQ